MTAPCSCSPGACHGGHTINEDRLRHIRDGWVTRGNETLEMAAELLAARARITELEAVHARLVEDVASTVRRFSATLDERDALRARVAELAAAQREPIGYGVVTTYLGSRWVQTAPVVSLDAAQARARVYVEQDARVVELHEVAE